MNTSHPLTRTAAILGLTLLGSYATAIVYVCVFTWTLPPSDGAYGQPPFSDSIVGPVMAVGATAAAAVIAPFALVVLWKADLRRSALLVFPVAIATVSLAAPFLRPPHAMLVGLIATVSSMAICSWLFRRRAHSDGGALVERHSSPMS